METDIFDVFPSGFCPESALISHRDLLSVDATNRIILMLVVR